MTAIAAQGSGPTPFDLNTPQSWTPSNPREGIECSTSTALHFSLAKGDLYLCGDGGLGRGRDERARACSLVSLAPRNQKRKELRLRSRPSPPMSRPGVGKHSVAGSSLLMDGQTPPWGRKALRELFGPRRSRSPRC